MKNKKYTNGSYHITWDLSVSSITYMIKFKKLCSYTKCLLYTSCYVTLEDLDNV